MTIASAAPNDAADDRPSVNGLTSGLRRSPCITVPAIARLMPVRMARMIRGRRNPTTISSACGFYGAGMVNGIASYHPGTVGRYVCRDSGWKQHTRPDKTDPPARWKQSRYLPIKWRKRLLGADRPMINVMRCPLPSLYRECTVDRGRIGLLISDIESPSF